MTHLNLGLAYINTNNQEEAIKHFSQAESTLSGFKHKYGLEISSRLTGLSEKYQQQAKEILSEFIEQDHIQLSHELARVFYNTAYSYHKEGASGKAREYYEKAIPFI